MLPFCFVCFHRAIRLVRFLQLRSRTAIAAKALHDFCPIACLTPPPRCWGFFFRPTVVVAVAATRLRKCPTGCFHPNTPLKRFNTPPWVRGHVPLVSLVFTILAVRPPSRGRGLLLCCVPLPIQSVCFFAVSLSLVPLVHEQMHPDRDPIVPFLRFLVLASLPFFVGGAVCRGGRKEVRPERVFVAQDMRKVKLQLYTPLCLLPPGNTRAIETYLTHFLEQPCQTRVVVESCNRVGF